MSSGKKDLITDGLGLYRRMSEGQTLPKGWTVVKEFNNEDLRDDLLDQKQVRKELTQKLESNGIPFDGRSSTSDLEKLWKEFEEANGTGE